MAAFARAPYRRAFSVLLVAAAAACGPDPAAQLPQLGAEVPLEAALAAGEIMLKELELPPVARASLVPHARRGKWPPIYDFSSEPLDVHPSTQVSGAIGMKTYGIELQEGDRPTFRLLAEGAEGHALLLEKTGTVDFPPDQWLPFRINLPESIGSPVKLRFIINYPPNIKPGAPKSTGTWAVPRVLRRRKTALPNVLLIVFDTLRADRTGLYGYDRPTTPFLDRLAKRGAMVEDVIAPYPSTLTSHWSIFTGLSPPRHRAYPEQGVRPEAETLAEILRRAGYLTAAFTEGGFVHSFFGFGRGFDLYHNGPDRGTNKFSGNARDTFKLARDWLAEQRDTRFFVFLHTYQVHSPYEPPRRELERFETDYDGRWAQSYPVEASFAINNGVVSLRPAEIAHLGALYDAEIRYLDDAFADLWEELEGLEVLDDTLVVITSDHGEDLMEHGWMHHGTTLYDPALRVPLVVIWKGRVSEDSRLRCQRALVDLMPTILELIGLQPPQMLDGRSFAKELRAGVCDESRPAYAELRNSAYKRHAGIPMASVRDGAWKLIAHEASGDAELYHLSVDPGEDRNLIQSEGERAQGLLEALAAYLAAGPRTAGPGDELTPEMEEQLRGLGYLE